VKPRHHLSVSARALLASSAAILVSLAACRQLVGITDNPPMDLTSTLCGLPYGTSVCASCVNTNCCTESTTCAADPVCSAYEGCLGKCNGDPKCRSQCTIDYPVGTVSDVSALSACLAANCETACGLTCGGIADLISEPDAAVACQQCLAGSPCSQAKACASSEACYGDLWSTLGLTSGSAEVYEQLLCAGSAASGLNFQVWTSVEVCGTNPPTIDADAALSSTATAFTSSCATPCSIGNYWACVGHVSWPPPAPTCAIGYRVTDYVTGAPVARALASVCSPTDPNCSQPLHQGTTDANGQVSLTVPTDTGLGSPLGFLRVTSPNIVPYDQYWGFPLIQAQLPIYTGEAITPTENQQLLNSIHIMQDPTRGQLSVQVNDCRLAAAPGVKITLSPADLLTQGFSSTGSQTFTTDQTGFVLFVNVPSGLTQITATPLALGKPSSQIDVNVQPGAITVVGMYPTPTP
jgi:hypothetical protein